ncbi:MAG: serine/threonine protein kinase [Rhodothermales bacterium]|jgi:serine/threonine protein kinase
MSSLLIPRDIITNYEEGVFQCPYCGTRMALTNAEPLEASNCPNCEKLIMFPHKISHYWLFQVLGGGGMGIVYKAFHEHHHRSVYAVKILPRHARQNRRLFLALQREAQMSTRFAGHPTIVNVVAHGWSDGEYFMASEYIKGETLTARIDRLGCLDELEALNITLDLLGAVQFVASKSYLYRDLKPDNVLVNDQGRAFLLDFGLCLPRIVAARDLGDVIEASPIYVPPERLVGEGEDVRSEIYSLGMLLYQAALGCTYFNAKEADSLLRQHVSQFRLSDSLTRLDKLTPDLGAVVSKMIKRQPQDRYQDCRSLAADLQALVAVRLPA